MSESGVSDPRASQRQQRKEDSPDGRTASFERLKQLILETEALASPLSQVPDELIWQRPGEQPSIAELLWFIHLSDEFRFIPVVDAVVHGDEPRLEHINVPVLLSTDPAPEGDLKGILDQIIKSREKLIDQLEQVPESRWAGSLVIEEGIEVDCTVLSEDIARHDAEILKEIGSRLLASNRG
jgi:hypothetical protein